MSIVVIDPNTFSAALDTSHAESCERRTSLLFNPCGRCAALVLGRHLIPEDLWVMAFGEEDAGWVREHLLRSILP